MRHEVRVAAYDSADAQLLTDEVLLEYVQRYGGDGDVNPIDPAEFVAPEGLFLMAYVDGVPAAMGGWRRHGGALLTESSRTGEIRRMYVRPQFQRLGLARALLARIESTAAEAGLTRMILETGTAQPEAIELYRSAGYADIPAFGFYADYDDSVHLGKELTFQI